MCYCNNKLPQKDVPKNKHFEKRFSAQELFCTCDQEILKILVEEFYFSKIIVLYPATLPNNELFHSHFFKVFNHNCRMAYYNGTVTLC